MNNIKIPYESKQKFQIGDVCKLIHGYWTDDVEEYNKEKEFIILGSYAQEFWGNDYASYSICELGNLYGSSSWWNEDNIEFIRKPSQNDIEFLLKEDEYSQSCIFYRKSIFGVKNTSGNAQDE
jgi:hypothetical protein